MSGAVYDSVDDGCWRRSRLAGNAELAREPDLDCPDASDAHQKELTAVVERQ
jgi:hypothetical protein